MHQIHLEKCDSTQKYLKEHLAKLLVYDKNLLVSTSLQSNGIGRSGNRWDFFTNSLAFSFTLDPNEEKTLSSLEVGVLLVNFFAEKNIKDLSVKWPNDILNTMGEKCGGVLCQLIDNNLIVGIGLNFQNNDSEKSDYKFPIGYINQDFSNHKNFHKDLTEEIYRYILDHRLSKEEVRSLWNEKNYFKDKLVTIEDGKNKVTGTFVGIGPMGEAIIKDEASQKSHSFVTGSLS